jgi:PAS domain S-box-containing protein
MPVTAADSAPPLPVPPRAGIWGGAGLLALSLLVAAVAGVAHRRDVAERVRHEVSSRAAAEATAIQIAIDQRMLLLRGVQGFVEINKGRPGFAYDFDGYARHLVEASQGVRALQIVEDGVITHIYPVAGNEAARGFQLRNHPDPAIWLDLQRVVESQDIVLTGPLRLIQGGLGFIGRLAARDDQGRLLCVVAVVLDLPPVLEEAGFESGEIRFALRSGTGIPIYGPDSLFAGDHVEVPVQIQDRRWLLAAAPPADWSGYRTGATRLVQVMAFLASLMLGGLVWLWLSRRAALARARDEEIRRLAEAKYHELFALSPDGVVMTRLRDGLVVEANDAFLRLTGWSRAEVVGQLVPSLGLWARPEERTHLISLVLRKGSCSGEPCHLSRRDGRVREIEFSARLLPDEESPLMLSVVRDVSDKRELERQIAAAQRMEAIGRLAGGVAHDFNNLLTVIIGAAETTRLAVPEGHPAQEESAEILRAAGRATDLTRQLLAFARRSVVSPRRVDVNALVRDAERLLNRILGEDVELTVALEPSLPAVLIDPTQLEQVLLNLVVNARDAMPEGGRLTIRTETVPDGVALIVQDTGTGIAEEIQPYIFEPFFTSKGPGQGTGLGLATCYGIVQQANGRIRVHSRAGAGATFTVVLPPVADPADPPPTDGGGPENQRAREGERVLLVEDDPQVRAVSRRILTSLGYDVLVAADGEEGLRVARESILPIHLVATDVVMPRRSGVELAAALSEARPDLPVLYLTGYSEDYAALTDARARGAVVLLKPFTAAGLAAAIRRALDQN